ncbi:hypothetical protein M3664_05855 [Paenibacillus lautus]|uniref:hypothetical protein n=1 Tax=Paenibacillus lautus TaxID=1401 RepID=UPI00204203E6|nr:hypothetical protein [Paenibacillus lautus]MCM3257310.1 hypothetical protein [Paenibacillus lautus]
MQTFVLDYYRKHRFEFVGSLTEHYLEGSLIWNEYIKNKIRQIDEIIDNENKNWYLDLNGYRLEDIELFKNSPWSIINDDNEIKIVSRFFDYGTGEARFALKPWFRTGDELLRNNKD